MITRNQAKKRTRQIRQVDFRMADWAQPLFHPYRRKVLYGGRGSGKSWQIAAALIILAHKRPLRVVCAREHQKSLRESAKKVLEGMIKRLGLASYYQITQEEIRHRNGSLFFFSGLSTVSEEDIRGWEDVDIVWIEEAHRMSNSSWEILRNTIRKDGSEIWMSFNPKNRFDPAYKHFVARQQPGAWVKKVNYYNNPWFPKELELSRQDDKRVEPERYAHIWLGMPDDVSDQRRVLPYHLLDLCVQSWKDRPVHLLGGQIHAGLDVADTGVDRNAYVIRQGPEMLNVKRWSSTHLGRTARRANTYCLEDNVARLYFDATGIGAGIRSHLIDMAEQVEGTRLAYGVRPIEFGGAVEGKDVMFTRRITNGDFFFQKKEQMGWNLRLRAEATQRWLDTEDAKLVDPTTCLFINPEIKNLEDCLAEMSQPVADENTSGKMVIDKQPKEPGSTVEPPSPDRYDGAILAFAHDTRRGLKRAA